MPWNGKPLSVEGKRKLSKNNARYWLGKNLSRNHKEEISKALKGRATRGSGWEQTKNTKKKISKALVGIRRSEKFKKRRSECMLDYIKNNPGRYKDTKPELRMKEILSSLDISFEHQVRIGGINHLFDFKIKDADVFIEVDSRYWHTLPGRRQRDYKINRLAKDRGFILLRFWEKDIMKNELKVVNKLAEVIDE